MIKRIWDVTLTVVDLKRAVDFYENTLGLQKKYEYRDYAGFNCGGIEIGLRTWGGLKKSRQGEPVIDFVVDNVDETYRKLNAKGVEFIKTPEETIWGSRFAVFTDPDGNTLQIVAVDWNKYFPACAPK